MKKLLMTTAVAVLAAVNIYAQGTINFATIGGGANARLWNGRSGKLVGGAEGEPAANYRAQLWYTAGGAADDTMRPAGDPVTPANNGYIIAGRRDLDIAGGTAGKFQVRAWEAVLGATWAEAMTAWMTGNPAGAVLGSSPVVTIAAVGNPGAVPPTPPASLVGLTGNIVLNPVPEPSVVGLGALGLVALLFRRRK